jgi:Holliday junction resolvase RusA-like endonuclease
MDSGNIVGGILDSLQGIIYKNDNQVIQISYVEWLGKQDRYQVTVTELTI